MATVRFGLLAAFFAIFVGAWVISYQKPTEFDWAEVHGERGVLCIRIRTFTCSWGGVSWMVSRLRIPLASTNAAVVEQRWRARFPPYQRRNFDGPVSMPPTSFAGLGYLRDPKGLGSLWGVLVPFWLPAMLLMVPPLRLVMRRWVAVDRNRRGMCSACGYDLRGTDGRCPECWTDRTGVALAPTCAPAAIAVARSSATIGLSLMAAYMAVAIVLDIVGGYQLRSWTVTTSEAYAAGVIWGVMVIVVLLGTFHGAGYSRSTEAFFAFGGVGGLLLAPIYVWLGTHCSVPVQLMFCIGSICIFGLLARSLAVLRWRMQDGPSVEKDDTGPSAITSLWSYRGLSRKQ